MRLLGTAVGCVLSIIYGRARTKFEIMLYEVLLATMHICMVCIPNTTRASMHSSYA